MFPEDYMPGVDVVIPDFHYLKEHREDIRAIILTHGHEDHIGALPFLLKEFQIPVYGTRFTLALLREKLKEHELPEMPELKEIRAGDRTRISPFEVEYIQVNHSIIDGVGLAIHTPEGIMIHSGDFKIDHTSKDEQATDLNRFAQYGDQKVLALFSDSTNVEKEGFTLNEIKVREALEAHFRTCRGRLIVAVFASNIGRIQHIIDLAIQYKRKVVFSGKSMVTNVRIAKEEGYLNFPDEIEIGPNHIESVPDNQMVMITTGSQGEPLSSLTRMAQDRHKGIKIKEGDTVILSSRFIPGNEKSITRIINSLYRMGAEVVYEKISPIHSSGHAYQEELKLLLNLVRPKFFIPIHGEYRHLVKHVRLAHETGLKPEQCRILENGTPLCFENGTARFGDPIHTGRILVDGKGVGDVGDVILRDRRRLSGDGIVILLLAVDERSGEIIYGPDIISRGFVFGDQEGRLLQEAKSKVQEILDHIENPSHADWTEIGTDVKRSLKRFFYKAIERRPLILLTIMPI